MIEYYSNANKFLIAVDCIVFGYDIEEEELKLLLVKRKINPQANEWSLIGSFVREGESISKSAVRVLEEFTGLTGVFLQELKSYGNVLRDSGGRVISIAHWSLIKLEHQKLDIINSHGAEWFRMSAIPDLVLDHNQMLKDGHKRLMNLAQNFPIGKELLPDHFTLPQLLKLYSSIFDKPIDDRNFRKKILSTNVLIKQNYKDKTNSKKGAFYYKFDPVEYENLLKSGYQIHLL